MSSSNVPEWLSKLPSSGGVRLITPVPNDIPDEIDSDRPTLPRRVKRRTSFISLWSLPHRALKRKVSAPQPLHSVSSDSGRSGQAQHSQTASPEVLRSRALVASPMEPLALTAFSATSLLELSDGGEMTHLASESGIQPFGVRHHMGSIDAALQSILQPKLPAATLPTELIQAIYWRLGPTDFNAARHTCRNWMAASLDYKVLIAQLKRGGWWSVAAVNSTLFMEWRTQWPMSCFLARECALAGNWTGNGLLGSGDSASPKPLVHADVENFVGIHADSTESVNDLGQDPIVTTSLCGGYCLIALGSTIKVYKLDGHAVRLLGRVTCEKTVLKMSMYATAEHVTLAALLEDRIGVYVDLRPGSKQSLTSSP